MSPDGATVEDYSLDRVRIDLYNSQLTSLTQGLFKTSAFDLASILDPSETATKIDRELSDAMALVLNEDIEISNIVHILRTIGERLASATFAINSAIVDMAVDAHEEFTEFAPGTTAYSNPTDVTILQDASQESGSGVTALRKYYLAAARNMIRSLREDVSEKTLTLLSPDQVSRMSADYFGFSNLSYSPSNFAGRSAPLGSTRSEIPISKSISPSECHILKGFSKLPIFAPESGNGNLKILSIGIPAGTIQKLRSALATKISSMVSTSDDGLVESVTDFSYLLNINVHKKNLQDDFAIYRPKTFTFNPTSFILPTSTHRSSDPIDAGTLVDVANFYTLRIENPDGGTQNFSLNSSAYEHYQAYVDDMYPLLMETIGAQGSYEVGFNHLASYCVNRYLKMLAGINLDVSGFQFGEHGFLQSPNPNSRNLYDNMINYAKSKTDMRTVSGARYVDSLKRTAMTSTLFNVENFTDRCVNCTMFDRVVNVIIDPSSFERIEMPEVPTDSGGGGSSSPISTGGGGGGSPAPTPADSSSSGVVKESMVCDEALYDNYFITISMTTTAELTPGQNVPGAFTDYDIGIIPSRETSSSGGGGGSSPTTGGGVSSSPAQRSSPGSDPRDDDYPRSTGGDGYEPSPDGYYDADDGYY